MGVVSNDFLKQLAPAHAPPPPGWWPPAPGWWLLAALLLVTIVLLLMWLRQPRRQLRRIALRELEQLEIAGVDDADLARGLEHLLRRYALARYGHGSVARLSGESWINFVAAHGGTALAGEPGRDLLRAAYGSGGSCRPEWLSGVRSFLKARG
ncbi:MAG: DUF4381 domain-containing protein [Stenotrophobium sp.]